MIKGVSVPVLPGNVRLPACLKSLLPEFLQSRSWAGPTNKHKASLLALCLSLMTNDDNSLSF